MERSMQMILRVIVCQRQKVVEGSDAAAMMATSAALIFRVVKVVVACTASPRTKRLPFSCSELRKYPGIVFILGTCAVGWFIFRSVNAHVRSFATIVTNCDGQPIELWCPPCILS